MYIRNAPVQQLKQQGARMGTAEALRRGIAALCSPKMDVSRYAAGIQLQTLSKTVTLFHARHIVLLIVAAQSTRSITSGVSQSTGLCVTLAWRLFAPVLLLLYCTKAFRNSAPRPASASMLSRHSTIWCYSADNHKRVFLIHACIHTVPISTHHPGRF